MTDPAGRLLKLLSLLQRPREWPGSELAARLEVSLRTVRRDVERLRELGYPVQATMGATGGYRLVAGKAMPPLLLDDEEAVAIAIGLRTAARHAISGIEEASVRALAKLEQVLPSRLGHRVTSIGAATVPMLNWEQPTVDPDTLTVLAAAISGHERLRFGYRSHRDAQAAGQVEAAGQIGAARLVEPHRLVSAGRRWYLVGYDNDRADWRIFRIDRISDLHRTGVRVPPRELPAGDAAEFVTRRMYEFAPVHHAVVTLHAPVDQIAGRLGDASGLLEPVDENTCRLNGYADTVEWLAIRLAALGCEFDVHDPPELAEYLRALGDRATRAGRRRA